MIADQRHPLDTLNSVISGVVKDLDRYKKHPEDFTRTRKLPADTFLKVTLNMQGNSLNAELFNAFPNIDDRMTASAYEQAKDKLNPQIFEDILREFNKTAPVKLLNDKYRVFAIDGCDFTTPYNPVSENIMYVNTGRPRKDGEDTKPYCQIHANFLYDTQSRLYWDCIMQPKPKANERDAAIEMIKRLDNSSPFIVIMDRGYDGFNMIETLNRIPNCYYIIRTKAGHGGIREIGALPDKDCDKEMTFRVTTSNAYYVTWKDTENIHMINHSKRHYKKYMSPNTKQQRWDFEQFCNVKCRVVKFRINDPDTGRQEWEVLLTNLNRFEFPIPVMKEMYHSRWDIETSFRELKYALGGINFHSKKDDFIKMELWSHFIMFNAVSMNIARVKVPQQADNKWNYAVDFKMACTITRKYFRIDNHAPPDGIYAEILGYTNPVREGRTDRRKAVKPKTAVWFVYRVA